MSSEDVSLHGDTPVGDDRPADDRAAETRDRLSDMARRMTEMGKAMATLRDRLEAVAAENEQLRATVDEQADEIDALHRERVRLARRLAAVEEAQGIDATTATVVANGETTSPLYLLESVGPEAVAEHPGPTLYRARVLVENRDRWGETRTNATFGRHRLLATRAHDLKQRLEDARDETLQWGQVYPALRKVARLGGDHVQFVESYASEKRDYGKAVVWEEVDPS